MNAENEGYDRFVYRNGRLYDRLNSGRHAVMQIVASLAEDMPGDHWIVKNLDGTVVYEIVVSKKKTP